MNRAFLTRWARVSLPMAIVLLVAIFTVHLALAPPLLAADTKWYGCQSPRDTRYA